MKNDPEIVATDSMPVAELDKIVIPTGVPLNSICFPDKGRMHRRPVPLSGEASSYHVMSRTVDGLTHFTDDEKEAFRMLVWRMAKFSGIEVLTYCVMGNHFHLLARVPPKEKFIQRFAGAEGEERLFKHLRLLYSNAYVTRLRAEIDELRQHGRERDVEKVLSRFTRRFCDLSLYVKELKERYSRWYNKKHSRRGTLWMARYKSVLVEPGGAMAMVAAYIDLNPIRAGLVKNPEDYRWCGYTEALAGSKRLRRGLCRAIGWPIDHWELSNAGRMSGAEVYREKLFEAGMDNERRTQTRHKSRKRRGIALEKTRKVIEEGGKLTTGELLSHRVRWLSEGVALGSEEFVGRALGDPGKAGRLRELPLNQTGDDEAWYCMSRWLRQGVG